MKVEMSLGDVVDRVTILLIKSERFDDPAKLANVHNELEALRSAWTAEGQPPMEGLADWAGLRTVNEKLWDVEDLLREHERRADFGADFVALARSVYHLNDRRAARKRAINTALGSRLIEEKSYADYGDGKGVPGLG
jgi:hypothetical protein